MITSMVDGRIRIRNSRLKENAFASALMSHLSAVNGVKEVLINRRVGSALIVYDPSITTESIISLIGRFLDITQKRETQQDKKNSVNIRKTINIGLLFSLLASLTALVFGSRLWHLSFGLVFLGFVVTHIFKTWKTF